MSKPAKLGHDDEEELKHLREQLAQRDELIQRQQVLLAEQNAVIQ